MKTEEIAEDYNIEVRMLTPLLYAAKILSREEI